MLCSSSALSPHPVSTPIPASSLALVSDERDKMDFRCVRRPVAMFKACGFAKRGADR